jgi:Coenzyme PQQ synthesis protein D (PqqD)
MQGQSAESDRETIRLDESRVTWREVDGEVVAVDVNTAEYLTMNGSGALLWRALASGATEEELASTLVGTYEISSDQADTDVDLFLRVLRDRGLVNCIA